MTEFVAFLQEAVAVAFVVLGVATAYHWLRRRDGSIAFLALAIVLLAAVVGLGRVQAHVPFTIPLLGDFELIAFAGSAYALLRYRDALIPLPGRWHVAAIASLVAASALLIAAQAAGAPRTLALAILAVWIAVWCVCVLEPIVRFWLVARRVPAVQAWRLRSLSLGFGGLVAVLLLAISIGVFVRQPVMQAIVELITLAIVPLLYASFAPPAWLRRQWRAEEEEELRVFMENLIVSDDRDALASRALELGIRLVGGASGVLYDAAGKPTAARGIAKAQVEELGTQLGDMRRGVNQATLGGAETTVLAIPVAGLSASGTFVVLAGPFTPEFGGHELSRMQQLMSAF